MVFQFFFLRLTILSLMQLNAKITDSPQLLFLTSEEKTYEFFFYLLMLLLDHFIQFYFFISQISLIIVRPELWILEL